MSITNFCHLLQEDEALVGSAGVAKRAKKPRQRTVVHADIAADLVQLRGEKSAGQMVSLARRRGHTALTPQSLRGLEEGTTRYPDQALLRAFADAYGMDYEPLAWLFIKANYALAPEWEPPELSVPLDPEVETAARLLESFPPALRTTLLAALHTLAEALGIDRRTGRSA